MMRMKLGKVAPLALCFLWLGTANLLNGRIVEDRFRAGVVKSIDLLDAATAQREAEMRELVARADAWLTHLHLALAAGLAPETVLSPSTPRS